MSECAFWDNFSVVLREHLCYETNPTPRRNSRRGAKAAVVKAAAAEKEVMEDVGKGQKPHAHIVV